MNNLLEKPLSTVVKKVFEPKRKFNINDLVLLTKNIEFEGESFEKGQSATVIYFYDTGDSVVYQLRIGDTDGYEVSDTDIALQ
jgi:hypothetical protein